LCAQQKCAEPRANIKKRRRHNSSTSAETVWSSRYGCGLSCRHGGESGETCKQYQCAAKDRASAERPRRLRAAQEKPPGIFRPRNIPARWSGAVASRVPFSNFWTIALGPLSQNFLGNLFLRSSGFPGRPPGWSGAVPASLRPRLFDHSLPKFFGIKNRVPKTYIYQSAFCKRGHSLSASLRKRPKCCVAAN